MIMMSMVYESAVVYIVYILLALVVLIILVAGLYFLLTGGIRQQQRQPGRSDVRGSRSSPTGTRRAESECITRVVDDGPGQVDEKYRKAPYGLRSFIRNKVIEKLNQQRNDLDKDQFAALILSAKDLYNINDVYLETRSNQLVNPSKRSHPDTSDLGNYMVARPDEWGNHAEVILLQRFNNLLQSFGEEPSIILIFSWLMPCVECTKAIIAFKTWNIRHQIIVVFRSNYLLYSEKVNEDNRERLVKADIEVYHITYSYDLPRN